VIVIVLVLVLVLGLLAITTSLVLFANPQCPVVGFASLMSMDLCTSIKQ